MNGYEMTLVKRAVEVTAEFDQAPGSTDYEKARTLLRSIVSAKTVPSGDLAGVLAASKHLAQLSRETDSEAHGRSVAALKAALEEWGTQDRCVLPVTHKAMTL